MKEVLAYREIKKENNKKTQALLWILLGILGICGVICFINPMNEESFEILGYIFIFMSILYGFIILLVSKMGEKIKRLNTYPREAIVYENGFIFINDEQVKQIKVEDIKKVKGNKDTITGPYVTVVKKTGSVKIITQNDKYRIEQLEDVDATVASIKKYINK